MIPRLIVAAILVNISFWIAALAVDLSNLLGYNLVRLFGSFNIGEVNTGGESWDGVLQTILAGGVGIALVAAIALAPAVLLALGLIVLILVARKALIVLLVIISPLAFVAYLLPNTEDWFKKWYKMFFALLMVFPVIAVVFGASKLASDVLIEVAKEAQRNSDENQYMLFVVALAVASIPLFAVPAILKGSLSAAGSIGAKLQGAADRSSARASKTLGGKASDRWDRTAYKRGKALRKQAKDNYRNEKFAEAMSGSGRKGYLRRAAARGATPLTSQIPGLRGSAKKQGQYIDRAAYNVADKADSEEVDFAARQAMSAAVATAASKGVDAKDTLQQGLNDALRRGDSVSARAHMEALEKTGEQGIARIRDSIVGADKARNFDGNEGAELKGDIMKHVNAKSSMYKAKDVRLDKWKNTGVVGDLASADYDQITDEQVASQTEDSLASSNITRETAQRILSNPDTSKDIKGRKRKAYEHMAATGQNVFGKKEFTDHQSWTPPPATPQPTSPPPNSSP